MIICYMRMLENLMRLKYSARLVAAISVQSLDGTHVFVGLHAYDRDHKDGLHDQLRVEQMHDVLRHIAQLDPKSSVIAGDLNSMYPDTLSARLLKKAGVIAGLLPSKNPGEKQSHLERVGSLSQRLSAMAIGGSIKLLENLGYVDADMQHAGTIRSGIIHADLDHFFGKGVSFSDFEKYENILSDHDALTARITY